MTLQLRPRLRWPRGSEGLAVRFTKEQLDAIEEVRANEGFKTKADAVRHIMDLGIEYYKGDRD